MRCSSTPPALPPASVDLAAENASLRSENERLRLEQAILKKRYTFSRSAEMKFCLIKDQRERFPVRLPHLGDARLVGFVSTKT
jgi:transposase-like protein